MPEPAVYPPAVLRVTPEAIPTLRAAIEGTLDELIPVLDRLGDEGWIPEPWLGDSESHKVWRVYNDQVMGGSDGPYQALRSYQKELENVRGRLAEMEREYTRVEDGNATLMGQL